VTLKQRTMIILPVCLLLFNAAQEVVEYMLPRFVPNPYYRTAVLIFLFVIGFAVIGDILVPWIAELLDKGHKTSKTQGGNLGIILFYSGTFAAIYVIYYIIYIKGPQFIIPAIWR